MNLFRKLMSAGVLLFLLSTLLPAASPSELQALSRPDDAIRLLTREVNANPKDSEAYSLLCRLYFQLDDWDHAIASGEHAVELSPNVGAYHLWLGRAYGRKAETVNLVSAFILARKVVREFERANQLDPGDWGTRRDLADFYVQAPMVVGGGEYKARRLANSTESRDAAGASIIRAMIARQKKDRAEAERQLKIAVQKSGGAAGPWLELARFYRDGARWDAFDDAVRQAVGSAKKTSEDLFDTGELLGGVGRMLPQAAEALRLYLGGTTVDEHVNAFRAHYLLGQVLERSGDRQAAIDEYRSSLAMAHGYQPARDALRRLGA